MTYEEVKKLQLSKIIVNTDLKKLAKECLSILDTSTLKDNEIVLFINAGVLDLKRQGIDAENKIQDELIQAAIIMYVKSNFGMVDVKEKEVARRNYELLCNNLGLSSEYKVVENNA